MTVGLAVCALILGLILAMLFAVWESSRWKAVSWLGTAWVTVLRGLPEILVVLFIYFGSSQLLLMLSDGFTLNLGLFQLPIQLAIDNFEVSPFLCGVIALALLYSAYASQTLRGALKAVPQGQWESGQALQRRSKSWQAPDNRRSVLRQCARAKQRIRRQRLDHS